MIDSSSPNQPIQNYEVVNPSLEQQVANLLPSVAGYGGNLRSTNTIIPIVDLTAAAEGSVLPEYLQRAWGFETGFSTVRNTTTTIVTNTGFWQCGLTCTYSNGSPTGSFVFIDDGTSTKTIWYSASINAGSGQVTITYEFIAFLRAGDNLKVTAAASDEVAIWYKQIASIDGTLNDPLGFA
jgi:hypothetical protein